MTANRLLTYSLRPEDRTANCDAGWIKARISDLHRLITCLCPVVLGADQRQIIASLVFNCEAYGTVHSSTDQRLKNAFIYNRRVFCTPSTAQNWQVAFCDNGLPLPIGHVSRTRRNCFWTVKFCTIVFLCFRACFRCPRTVLSTD